MSSQQKPHRSTSKWRRCWWWLPRGFPTCSIRRMIIVIVGIVGCCTQIQTTISFYRDVMISNESIISESTTTTPTTSRTTTPGDAAAYAYAYNYALSFLPPPIISTSTTSATTTTTEAISSDIIRKEDNSMTTSSSELLKSLSTSSSSSKMTSSKSTTSAATVGAPTTLSSYWEDGRIQIPTYTKEMAKQAVRPQYGLCDYKNLYSKRNTQQNRRRTRREQQTPRRREEDEGREEQSSGGQRRHLLEERAYDSSEGVKEKDEQYDSNTKFAFVHIYKTAGSTLREFFLYYSHHCHVGWSVIISCTNINPKSMMQIQQPSVVLQAKYNNDNDKYTSTTTRTTNNHSNTTRSDSDNDSSNMIYWEPCKMKRLLQRNGKLYDFDTNKNSKKQPAVHRANVSLIEDYADIIGGHFKLGTADYLRKPRRRRNTHSGMPLNINTKNMLLFGNKNNNINNDYYGSAGNNNNKNDYNDDSEYYYKIRYMTFVREPLSKYVSGVVFHHKEIKTQEEFVTKIKTDVVEEMSKGKYWLRIGDYLLTPHQQQTVVRDHTTYYNNNKKQQQQKGTTNKPPVLLLSLVEYKTQLILQNLATTYNVIMGMTESMSTSMDILQHIFDPNRQLTELFAHYHSTTHSTATALTTNSSIVSASSPATATADSTTAAAAALSMVKDSDSAPSKNQQDDKSTQRRRQLQQQQDQQQQPTEPPKLLLPRKVVNKSRLSSKAILQELQNDTEFYELFVEYVKYEQLIYDYSKLMHLFQYDAITSTSY